MLRKTLLLFGLALAALTTRARAQDACACARSVCESMRESQHRSRSSCENMASLPPAACTEAAQDLLSRYRATGRAAPSSCRDVVAPVVIEGVVPSAPSNTGPMVMRAPTPAPPPADRTPTALAPDPPRPVASAAGRLSCELEHGARRVVAADTPVVFAVRCAGIPLPNEPHGTQSYLPPPARTADGRTVAVTWSTTSGQVAPDGLAATWRSPPTPPHPADVEVRATVTLADERGRNYETVVLTRTIHVVPRRLTLEVSTLVAGRCGPGTDPGASQYDVACHATIELEVSGGLDVRGRGGTPCDTPVITNLRACGDGTPAAPVGGFEISSASGRVDPDTGVLTLEVDGRPSRAPRAIAGSRRAVARSARSSGTSRRAAGGLPRRLELAPDDGAVRSFGSFEPGTGAGSLTTFTLRAR